MPTNVTGSQTATYRQKVSEQLSFGSDFGALADTIWVEKVSTTASSTTLAATVGGLFTGFTADDVGKHVRIPGVGTSTGAGGNYVHYSTIATVTDSTHVTLAAAPVASANTSMHFGNVYNAEVQAAFNSGANSLKLGSSPGQFIGLSAPSYMRPGCRIIGNARGNGNDSGNGFVNFNPDIYPIQFHAAMWGTVNVVAGSTTSTVTLSTVAPAGYDFSEVVAATGKSFISIAGLIYPIISVTSSTVLVTGPAHDPIGTHPDGPTAPNATGATFVLQMGPTGQPDIDGGFVFKDFSIVGAKGIQIQNSALENANNFYLQRYLVHVEVSSLFAAGDYQYGQMPLSHTSGDTTLSGLTTGQGNGSMLDINLSLRVVIGHCSVSEFAAGVVLSNVSASSVERRNRFVYCGNWIFITKTGNEGNHISVNHNELIGHDQRGGIMVEDATSLSIQNNYVEQIPQSDFASSTYIRIVKSYQFWVMANDIIDSYSSTAPLYDVCSQGPGIFAFNQYLPNTPPPFGVCRLDQWSLSLDACYRFIGNGPRFPIPDIPYCYDGEPDLLRFDYRNPSARRAFLSQLVTPVAGSYCPFTLSSVTGRYVLDPSLPFSMFPPIPGGAGRAWSIVGVARCITAPATYAAAHSIPVLNAMPFMAVDVGSFVANITNVVDNGDGTTTISLDAAHGMTAAGNLIRTVAVLEQNSSNPGNSYGSALDGADFVVLTYPSSTSVRFTHSLISGNTYLSGGALYRYCRVLAQFSSISSTTNVESCGFGFEIPTTAVDFFSGTDSFAVNLGDGAFFKVQFIGPTGSGLPANIEITGLRMYEASDLVLAGHIPIGSSAGLASDAALTYDANLKRLSAGASIDLVDGNTPFVGIETLPGFSSTMLRTYGNIIFALHQNGPTGTATYVASTRVLTLTNTSTFPLTSAMAVDRPVEYNGVRYLIETFTDATHVVLAASPGAPFADAPLANMSSATFYIAAPALSISQNGIQVQGGPVISPAEFGYLTGATSALQPQINALVAGGAGALLTANSLSELSGTAATARSNIGAVSRTTSVTAPTGGTVIDIQARAAIVAIIAKLNA